MVETQNNRRRIAKPLGLYIITIFDFIAVGVVPLFSVVWVARSQEIELPFVAVLTSVGLAITTMASAIWAWLGDNAGRVLLLALVTLSSVLLILNNVLLLSSDNAGTNGIRSLGWIFRAVFWIGINWWYFNRAQVVAYFKQNAV